MISISYINVYIAESFPKGYYRRFGHVPECKDNLGCHLNLTIEECAKKCNETVSCLSFEHSITRNECNLNPVKEPTNDPSLDFKFYAKQTGRQYP